MGLRIVERACNFSAGERGVVVVESDAGPGKFPEAFDELGSKDARLLAIEYAQQVGNIVPAHLNNNVTSPYPINSEGRPLDQVLGEDGQPLPPRHPRMQPVRYRIDVAVTRPIR